MPPSDRRSPRMTAVLCGIAVLVCVAIFIGRQLAGRRPTAEQPAENGGMFELVGIRYEPQRLPERFRFISYRENRFGKDPGIRSVTIDVARERGASDLRIGEDVPLHVLKLGEDIPGTEFKVAAFRQGFERRADNPYHDASTVTIVNKETGAEQVLPLKDIMDRGDARAYLRAKAAQPGGQAAPVLSARIGETFTFPAGSGQAYTVLDIKGRGAVIETSAGTKMLLTLPH